MFVPSTSWQIWSVLLVGGFLGGLVGCAARLQADDTKVPVTFSGGHDIDRRKDFGRPTILIAAALGVKQDVFREAFSGVTILTTNFEDTIDTAFKRRLTFRMRFEKPDAAARAALWGKVFPSTCELAADFDAERLGARFEISGGNIRNAAVRAAFLAASAGHAVDMATCVLAAERESREMGLLTPSPVEMVKEPIEPEPEEEPPRSPKHGPEKPAPRLVPITHRR